MEKYKEKQKIDMAFSDLEKAYDMISREFIWCVFN